MTTALRPPAAESTTVLVARHDLVPGSVLLAGDIAVEPRPAESVPRDSLRLENAAIGHVVSFPVRAGEALSARHVLSSALLEAFGPDTVATPMRLSDDAALALVQAGDVVDVIAARTSDTTDDSSSMVVASHVRVLVIASPPTASGGSGMLGSGGSTGGMSPVLVIATTPAQALDLARAAVGSRLSLILRTH
ncbi:unannotated protein [freshwater metagenome]|jgi:Flp pilus assembly protein CpaB|uniref:Unannotated protein n=1 Tax=freshwater metagenome TaxID=449393 RepID=A0A6J7HZV3_9ZZZZ